MISTFANSRHHLFCKNLRVHTASFNILDRGYLKPLTVCNDDVVGGNTQTRDATETEQIGGFGESGEICPPLTAVPPFIFPKLMVTPSIPGRAEAEG